LTVQELSCAVRVVNETVEWIELLHKVSIFLFLFGLDSSISCLLLFIVRLFLSGVLIVDYFLSSCIEFFFFLFSLWKRVIFHFLWLCIYQILRWDLRGVVSILVNGLELFALDFQKGFTNWDCYLLDHYIDTAKLTTGLIPEFYCTIRTVIEPIKMCQSILKSSLHILFMCLFFDLSFSKSQFVFNIFKRFLIHFISLLLKLTHNANRLSKILPHFTDLILNWFFFWNIVIILLDFGCSDKAKDSKW